MSNLPSPRAKRYYWKIYVNLINIYLIKVLNYDLLFFYFIRQVYFQKLNYNNYTKNKLLKLLISKRVVDLKIDWFFWSCNLI